MPIFPIFLTYYIKASARELSQGFLSGVNILLALHSSISDAISS
jgi:hypothetical protein